MMLSLECLPGNRVVMSLILHKLENAGEGTMGEVLTTQTGPEESCGAMSLIPALESRGKKTS